MTWEHGQLRLTKREQVVRPYVKETASDIQYCKFEMDYDSGSQVADGDDVAPIWWRGEADYPAWADYTLPLPVIEGELPNIPYYLLACHATMPTRVDIITRKHSGDTGGTTGCNFYCNFDLRAGADVIAKFYAFASSGIYWGTADFNTPHYNHDVTGYAEFREWNTLGTVIGKENLVPDNIRFNVRVASWVNLYTDITVRIKCEEYLALIMPEYRP